MAKASLGDGVMVAVEDNWANLLGRVAAELGGNIRVTLTSFSELALEVCTKIAQERVLGALHENEESKQY